MNYIFYFFAVLTTMLVIIIICDKKYFMLRDDSLASQKPYSFSRVQLAWWTVIVLSAFITIILAGKGIPIFDQSTLILLGISAATTAAAKVVDVADETNPAIARHQDANGENFFLDILSDEKGVSIHRFQTVVFNLVFGVWFIHYVLNNFGSDDPSAIMPVIDNNNLILLGLSSGVYAGLKITENKSGQNTPADAQPVLVPDEAGTNEKAEG